MAPLVRAQKLQLNASPFGFVLSEVTSFLAYDAAFAGGATVAACDLDGDGHADIVTGAGPGGGPHVRVIKRNPGGDLVELGSFFAYEAAFAGGVDVACGDVDGDGIPEIVTGPGLGGGPHVRILKRQPGAPGGVVPFADLLAYDPAFAGGVHVAVGDVDADGRNEVITGAGRGGGPHVRTFAISSSGAVTPGPSFVAYPPGFLGGVFVAGFQP
jgi:hypothetical protein